MTFPFYPKHEHGCQFVKCCPHVGGASLATLVLAATEQTKWLTSLHRTIDAERQRFRGLLGEADQLRQQLEQAKLELKLERQRKFATNGQQTKKRCHEEKVSRRKGVRTFCGPSSWSQGGFEVESAGDRLLPGLVSVG